MGRLITLGLAVAILVVLTAAEALRGSLDWRLRLINLQAWAVVLICTMFLQPLVRFGVPYSLISGPLWLTVPAFFIVMDLGEYLFHRAQHAIPAMWRMHSLHHSDPDMNATTTNRHFWGDNLLKAVTIWPLAAFIVQPTALAYFLWIMVSYWHYVCHSGLGLSFGRMSWLLNSPAYHRRHHSTLREHHDSNFAALFPIFDVIAGSYHRPDGFPETGLDKSPRHLGQMVAWPLL